MVGLSWFGGSCLGEHGVSVLLVVSSQLVQIKRIKVVFKFARYQIQRNP